MNQLLTAPAVLNLRAVPIYLFLLVSGLLTSFPSYSAVASLPLGFKRTTVANGINRPTAMAIAPDGRIFVAEQPGRIRVIKGGELLGTPFLDISSKVDPNGERGLLGIAFDPDFSQNHWVYVYYTSKTPDVHNRVSRFTAYRNVAIPGSEKVLLDIQPLSSATNHNGGAIHFGKDDKLYIAVGDNADGSNAQMLSNMKGKLLRINNDGSIPSDNPFYIKTSGKNRSIWVLGLRNPFTFGIQPRTGRIHINDVGQDTWEEINHGIKGANYGWPVHEGPSSDRRYQSPIFAYRHGTGNTLGCAITGGAFYNPATVKFPSSYVGDYFFGDLCNGWIRRYDISTRKVSLFITGLNSLVDIQVAQNGKLYYLERNTGRLTEVTYTGN